MRRSSLPFALALLLGACGTPTGPGHHTDLPTPTWTDVGAEVMEVGGTTRTSIDLSRTARADGGAVRTVSRLAFIPPRTDARSGLVYDALEYDQEMDCAGSRVRVLGVRSYRDGAEVDRGGAVMNGMAMQAEGMTRQALERACAFVGAQASPPR
ncbi:MAG TPA: hypothetical protein VK610_09310 [Rhodothermales bacterium]|nr:hypothetical protein [Rhodothermales bacterium]